MQPTPPTLELDKQQNDAYSVLEDAFDAGKGALLTGNPGTGKTLLLAEFARPFVSHPLPTVTHRIRHLWLDRIALWTSAAEFAEDVKAEIGLSRRADFTDFSDAFSATGIARSVPMLFVDDFGAEQNSDYTRSALEALVDARYRDRDQKKTWFTTNLTIPELLERYSDRTVSRLCDMCEIVIFSGADRRMARYLHNAET